MIEINGQTALYGIIGNPIKHTMSPKIHNTISEALGINAVYVPFVANDDLETIAKGLHSIGVQGLNVTVPYKTGIIKELAGVDSLANEIGAVNTLKYTDDGYYGYNTDILGLDRELKDEGVSMSGKHIVLLGAGGAARAVAFLCASKKPASITIVNRTISKGEEIQSDVIAYANKNEMDELAQNVKVISFDELKSYEHGDCIVFQCTNVGLAPNDNACIVDDSDFYKKVSVGVDLIYNPSETLFMKNVKAAGGRAYNGLKMLIYQAVCAYEIWNDVSVPESVIADIEKELS